MSPVSIFCHVVRPCLCIISEALVECQRVSVSVKRSSLVVHAELHFVEVRLVTWGHVKQDWLGHINGAVTAVVAIVAAVIVVVVVVVVVAAVIIAIVVIIAIFVIVESMFSI